MLASLKLKAEDAFQKVKKEIQFYRRLLHDPRTPFVSKAFIWGALFYLFLPFDLIPDWIPVLGQLDDLIIVPTLIWLGLKFVPKDLMEEVRTSI